MEKKLKVLTGFTIFIGAILKIMDKPYGPIIFTVGFAAYFLLKFIKLFKTPKLFWTNLHSLQLLLLILGVVLLVLMYYDYAYSRIGFVTVLLLESIVSLKIMLTALIGSDNLKMILTFIGRLLKR